MKKTLLSCLCLILCALFLVLPASASLTDAQKATMTDFVNRFLADGNAANKLVYGSGTYYRSIRLFTETRSDSSGLELPEGSPVTFPGEYLVLDCSAFFALMYLKVFGIRVDYLYTGMYAGGHHLSNWNSILFLRDYGYTKDGGGTYPYDPVMIGNEDLMRVRDLDGNETDLFGTVYRKDSEKTFSVGPVLAGKVADMEVGDAIVYYVEKTGWGHFMIYAGDGYVWHSTSTHESGVPYAMRRQSISTLANSANHLVIARLSDNILEPDFAGYNVPVDFSSLTTSSSSFDTTPPYFSEITVRQNGGNYSIDTVASDEKGGLKPLTYVYEPNAYYKSSGDGESGVLGVFLNDTGVTPDLYYLGWNKTNNAGYNVNAFVGSRDTKKTFTRLQNAFQILNEKGDVYDTHGRRVFDGANTAPNDTNYGPLLTAGFYYLWCKDASENISTRYRVVLSDGLSSVWLAPENGPLRLLGRFVDSSRYPISACDINGDGSISESDVRKTVMHISGEEKMISDGATDTNGDGVVNVLDAIRIVTNFGKTRER